MARYLPKKHAPTHTPHRCLRLPPPLLPHIPHPRKNCQNARGRAKRAMARTRYRASRGDTRLAGVKHSSGGLAAHHIRLPRRAPPASVACGCANTLRACVYADR